MGDGPVGAQPLGALIGQLGVLKVRQAFREGGPRLGDLGLPRPGLELLEGRAQGLDLRLGRCDGVSVGVASRRAIRSPALMASPSSTLVSAMRPPTRKPSWT